jgi:teichuronic acid biosynthesis glycosyltransferase TuaC
MKTRKGIALDSLDRPHVVVLSTLFPHPGQPNAGVFIRARMFRVAQETPLAVVSPQPWFPLQGLIRRFRPHFRPPAPAHEVQQGIDVFYPKFFSFPGLLKHWDGFFMALGARRVMKRLREAGRLDIIDSHFAYPDGVAARFLARWLHRPYTITLRGTEPRHARQPRLRKQMSQALRGAARVFSVSDSLRQLAIQLGAAEDRSLTVGNGVDAEIFKPVDRQEARRRFKIPTHAKVLISVGALVPRKGFQRVIACLPELLKTHPDLHYLAVGGASPEGDMRAELQRQAAELGVSERVHFLGAMPSAELQWPLSAADVFVLSTSNEGWANVFLEAMACGLPVVATDVGGNREVVCREDLGIVVPFDDQPALQQALADALDRAWDRAAILDYARQNSWAARVEQLMTAFCAIRQEHA